MKDESNRKFYYMYGSMMLYTGLALWVSASLCHRPDQHGHS
jgi:hypothetical protein